MKSIASKAILFAITCIVIAIFLMVGASNIISTFVLQKMKSGGEITLSILDMILISSQVSFVVSVVLLLVKQQKWAYIFGLFAIILSSFNMIVGSLMAQSINSDYVIIISSVVVGFILYCIFMYISRAKKDQVKLK